MSHRDYKANARRLQAYLLSEHDFKLNASAAHHAVAVAEGYRNWQVLSAIHHQFDSETSGPLSEHEVPQGMVDDVLAKFTFLSPAAVRSLLALALSPRTASTSRSAANDV